MTENITIEEIQRLQAIEQKQKERYKKQNEHTKMLYDRISFTVPIGKKKEIEKAAKSKGKTLNKFISEMVLSTYNNNALINNNKEDDLENDECEFIQVGVINGAKEVIKRLIGRSGGISEYCNSAIMTAIESDIDLINGRDMTIYEAAEEDINQTWEKRSRTAKNSEINPGTAQASKSDKETERPEIKANTTPYQGGKAEEADSNENTPVKAGFDGLKACEWNAEEHSGVVPHPPMGTPDNAIWDSNTGEWYEPLPF